MGLLIGMRTQCLCDIFPFRHLSQDQLNGLSHLVVVFPPRSIMKPRLPISPPLLLTSNLWGKEGETKESRQDSEFVFQGRKEADSARRKEGGEGKFCASLRKLHLTPTIPHPPSFLLLLRRRARQSGKENEGNKAMK